MLLIFFSYWSQCLYSRPNCYITSFHSMQLYTSGLKLGTPDAMCCIFRLSVRWRWTTRLFSIQFQYKAATFSACLLVRRVILECYQPAAVSTSLRQRLSTYFFLSRRALCHRFTLVLYSRSAVCRYKRIDNEFHDQCRISQMQRSFRNAPPGRIQSLKIHRYQCELYVVQKRQSTGLEALNL